MSFFISFQPSVLSLDYDFEELLTLLGSIDSPLVMEWLESRTGRNFTMEEFFKFLESIEDDEVKDWFWAHRQEFLALMFKTNFNFAQGKIFNDKEGWKKILFLTPSDSKNNKR
ncbi:MAG: hypothetical protein AB1393_06875 [Candidatus Edwardsbacteria bacterium]